ncbi:MAG: hypothetical protein IJD81_04895 [Oscillospiraceae bacterium]|nr:hypothetical protein [Oscillospiraceae bacterium]
MNKENTIRNEMLAEFGCEIMQSWLSAGKETELEMLRRVFLKSTITPRDVVAEARKVHLLHESMGTAIYNHIVYALYHEMRNNPQSEIVDEIYKCERNDISLHKKLLEYIQYLRDVKKGDYYDYSDLITTARTFFFMLYEKVEIPAPISDCMWQLMHKLRNDHCLGTTTEKFECTREFEDGQVIATSKVYAELLDAVTGRMVEYTQAKYPADTVSRENWICFLGAQLHQGLFLNEEQIPCCKRIDSRNSATLLGISTLGAASYGFCVNNIPAIMGNVPSFGIQVSNHHPDVDKLFKIAMQATIFAFFEGHADIPETRRAYRHQLKDYLLENINMLYDNLVNLYYVDCMYKQMEMLRDEYYYSFQWFYDVEKTYAPISQPMAPVPEKSKTVSATDNTTLLNAQYERERQRVVEMGDTFAHELAEKDRLLEKQRVELDELRRRMELQEEFFERLAVDDISVTSAAGDISQLYGRRFLFVGKVSDFYPELRRTFPNSVFMETENTNIKSVAVDAVVLLIKAMSHKMYYKVKNTGALSLVPQIYCNSKNINLVYDAMVAGMNAGAAVA